MTRKRFVKHLMCFYIQRNDAEKFARSLSGFSGVSYKFALDCIMRQAWARTIIKVAKDFGASDFSIEIRRNK